MKYEVLAVFSAERSIGILIKPMEDQNAQLTGVSKKVVSGHALHEKGFQRQIGVDTLVNSHQQRALAVPLINCGYNAGQMDVLFRHRFT